MTTKPEATAQHRLCPSCFKLDVENDIRRQEHLAACKLVDELRAENARQAETIAQQTRAIVELEQERHMLRIEVGSSKVSALRQKQQAETIAKLMADREALYEKLKRHGATATILAELREALKGSR